MFKIIINGNDSQTFFHWRDHLIGLAFVLVLIAAIRHAALFLFCFAEQMAIILAKLNPIR